MKGKKQNSGWGTLQSGGRAPPKQGFVFTFVDTEVSWVEVYTLQCTTRLQKQTEI